MTSGCIPLRNEPIAEVCLAAVDARNAGQRRVPVHIFPCRLDGDWLKLERQPWRRPGLLEFWRNLQEGYAIFQNGHRLPRVAVDRNGKYVFH